MEYCNGRDLINSLNRIYALEPLKKLHAFFQIASGVQHLHSLNIIHRDLKFDNILVHFENINDQENITYKIADFGLSKQLDILRAEQESKNFNSIRGGTFIYNAPESFVTFNYSLKADVFSMGIIFYGLLTKKLPFKLSELY